MIIRIQCPPLYEGVRERNPKRFVEYCKLFIASAYPGRKAIGVEYDGTCHQIVTIPDFSAVRPIVSGKGRTKKIERVKMWTHPPENYFSPDDIAYLKRKGFDKYGNKVDSE